MTDARKYGWSTTSIKREQRNGLRYLAAKDSRAMAQMLFLVLRKAGVPELSDQELEEKLKKLKVVVMEVEAR